MQQQAETVGKAKPPPPAGRYGRVIAKPDDMPPTLTGIDKNLAKRARAAGNLDGEHLYGVRQWDHGVHRRCTGRKPAYD